MLTLPSLWEDVGPAHDTSGLSARAAWGAEGMFGEDAGAKAEFEALAAQERELWGAMLSGVAVKEHMEDAYCHTLRVRGRLGHASNALCCGVRGLIRRSSGMEGMYWVRGLIWCASDTDIRYCAMLRAHALPYPFALLFWLGRLLDGGRPSEPACMCLLGMHAACMRLLKRERRAVPMLASLRRSAWRDTRKRTDYRSPAQVDSGAQQM